MTNLSDQRRYSVKNASTSINQVNLSTKYQSFINWNYHLNFYTLVCHVWSLLKVKCHWTKWCKNPPSNVKFNIFTVKDIEDSINVTVCEFQNEYYPHKSNSLSMTQLVSYFHYTQCLLITSLKQEVKTSSPIFY